MSLVIEHIFQLRVDLRVQRARKFPLYVRRSVTDRFLELDESTTRLLVLHITCCCGPTAHHLFLTIGIRLTITTNFLLLICVEKRKLAWPIEIVSICKLAKLLAELDFRPFFLGFLVLC